MTGALNSGYVPEDARSHISQFSTRSRSRSEHGLFGQSQSQRYPSRNGESTHIDTLSEYLGLVKQLHHTGLGRRSGVWQDAVLNTNLSWAGQDILL